MSSEAIQAAQRGEWSVLLTPNKSVPREWLGDVRGKHLLCLASGGGQQAPILAAAGAIVTSFDNSDEQLATDRFVAERDAIALTTIQGDMANLSTFEDDQFDLIFHPVANVFVENIRPVWQECFRVLKPGGRLLAGFMNPLFFLFDPEDIKTSGQLQVQYALPYSDLTSLPEAKKTKIMQAGGAFEFGHTLEDQIGGQINAGFVIAGFYEDNWDDDWSPLNRFTPLFLATLAIKLQEFTA
ncbi:MAG: class I SAM-dependent methyltransferase [Cyanobacteria bacterium J06559_3]